LAKGITLIESTRPDHRRHAAEALNFLVGQRAAQSKGIGGNKGRHGVATSNRRFRNGNTLRLGICGPPGVGKSSFIEAMGMRFVEQSYRVAGAVVHHIQPGRSMIILILIFMLTIAIVIPVDPSSHVSGGSILGDKTRMEQLSKSDLAYVRASPTRGVLGGIAEHTSGTIIIYIYKVCVYVLNHYICSFTTRIFVPDVITLCEVAGYDIVIVESVGTYAYAKDIHE
jgi:LAO/AO transport system kinase